MQWIFTPDFGSLRCHVLVSGAYESSLGRWIVALVKPVLAPLQRLPLQIAGLDLSVWVAIVLVRF